jgi:hypothetical protein
VVGTTGNWNESACAWRGVVSSTSRRGKAQSLALSLGMRDREEPSSRGGQSRGCQRYRDPTAAKVHGQRLARARARFKWYTDLGRECETGDEKTVTQTEQDTSEIVTPLRAREMRQIGASRGQDQSTYSFDVNVGQ